MIQPAHLPLKPIALIIVAVALVAPPAGPRASSQIASPETPLALLVPPARHEWVEALPIGNGRLAAMVFGGVDKERLQLNEDTLWAGGPYDPANPDALRGAARRAPVDLRREARARRTRWSPRRCMAKPLAADAVPAGRRSAADVSAAPAASTDIAASSISTRAVARVSYVSAA